MSEKFEVGDHVSWNSEAGRVSGTIVRVHTRDFDYKGYTHHASDDDPQYEIKSDKTDHVAAHKGGALRRAQQSDERLDAPVRVTDREERQRLRHHARRSAPPL